jgi:hypothetical protein
LFKLWTVKTKFFVPYIKLNCADMKSRHVGTAAITTLPDVTTDGPSVCGDAWL